MRFSYVFNDRNEGVCADSGLVYIGGLRIEESIVSFDQNSEHCALTVVDIGVLLKEFLPSMTFFNAEDPAHDNKKVRDSHIAGLTLRYETAALTRKKQIELTLDEEIDDGHTVATVCILRSPHDVTAFYYALVHASVYSVCPTYEMHKKVLVTLRRLITVSKEDVESLFNKWGELTVDAEEKKTLFQGMTDAQELDILIDTHLPFFKIMAFVFRNICQ